jgi:hypothetical protein
MKVLNDARAVGKIKHGVKLLAEVICPGIQHTLCHSLWHPFTCAAGSKTFEDRNPSGSVAGIARSNCSRGSSRGYRGL